MRALRRAELLGHPRAAALGTALAEIIPRFGRVRRGDDHAAVWAAATRSLDAEWAKGQAWVVRAQASEDRLVKRRPKQAFGY